MALNLRRRVGQEIILYTSDGPIRIRLTNTDRNYAGLSFNAPASIKIRRAELEDTDASTKPKET